MLTTTQSYVQYQGNGATTVFPFGFLVPAAGDLVVTITNNNVSPSVSTVLATSQYTVAGIGSSSGGTVTYPASGSPLPTGWTITIQRVVPYTQNTSLANQGALYPQVVENALDTLCMQIQQLAAALSGTVSLTAIINPSTSATLTGLVISGPTSVQGGSINGYAATAEFSDGSTAGPVGATWSVSPSTYGSISASGIFTAASVTQTESVTITASYTYGGVQQTATFTVSITQGSSSTMSQLTFLSTYGSLASAVSTLGSTSSTLIMDVANTVSANLTVPANINLVYLTAGITTVPAGVTLTIGGYAVSLAGASQMFSCASTGGVIFSIPQPVLYPQHFGADPTGTNDSTNAIQYACNACNSTNSAQRILTFTNGTFLINGQITVPAGVHLVGQSDRSSLEPQSSGITKIHGGTLLSITNSSSSPIVYQSGNLFQGLTFQYPNQSATQATPTSYPATFSPNTGVGNLTSVEWRDIQFLNAYVGIDARIAHSSFTFRRITGCGIDYGIRVDGGGADVFDDVSFSPSWWYGGSSNAATWMISNAIGIDMGLCADFRANNIAIGGYYLGLQLRQGSVNGTDGAYGTISQLALIGNQAGIYAAYTDTNGVHITNFMGDSNTGSTINIGSDNVFLRVSSGVCMGTTATPVCHIILGGGSILLDGISFSQPSTTVLSTASDTSINLQMIGCRCRGTGTINCSASSLASLILVGNLFGSAPTFAATPATTYRYVGNTNLSDH